MNGPGAAKYQVVHDHLELVIDAYLKSNQSTGEGVASIMALLSKYNVYQGEFRVEMSLRTLARPELTPEARGVIISIMAREHPYWLSDWWSRRKRHPPVKKIRITVADQWLSRFIRRGPRRLSRLSEACKLFGYEILPETVEAAKTILMDLVTYRASDKYQKGEGRDALDTFIYWLTGMTGGKAA